MKDGEAFISDVVSRLSTQTDACEAVKNADLVTEAIVENLDIKKQLFSALDKAAPEYVNLLYTLYLIKIYCLVHCLINTHGM